ncbi:cupin domain-containing protein [Thermophagus xiamenensis]|uniref:Cupin domain-containing protein n=1 Tax=Thermophagus xiamenensis TaxID=385682 RepID=A0A1I1ZZF8_9BACT|nr:cupin domain-containing protein [Thermophagus xiamenensis]SFE37055.1 Cupin domain-containing protein [Thermophagus xiamenensis]
MFFKYKDIPVEPLGKGVSRRILGHDTDIMMVQVNFEKGAIGEAHRHPHRQTSYVVSGVFEVTIGDETQILEAGDAFYVEPDQLHGVVCLEKGTLVDVFNPAREDFL